MAFCAAAAAAPAPTRRGGRHPPRPTAVLRRSLAAGGRKAVKPAPSGLVARATGKPGKKDPALRILSGGLVPGWVARKRQMCRKVENSPDLTPIARDWTE